MRHSIQKTYNVEKIIAAFQACERDGTPVFLTDGTVTRRVDKLNADPLYLNVHVQDSSVGWAVLTLNCGCFLSGYSAKLYPESGYFIAPDWWHDI